jgi:transposase-like protein
MNPIHTMEFKRQAVELSESLGNVKKAAAQLGIPERLLYGWRSKSSKRKESSSFKKTPSPELLEIKRLQKENAELKHINHALKIAAAFLSQDHLK